MTKLIQENIIFPQLFHSTKRGMEPIIIDGLSRCMQALGMPHMSRVVVIGFLYHPSLRRNYQECVSENKDGLRQHLECPKDYTRKNFFEMPAYYPKSKNQ